MLLFFQGLIRNSEQLMEEVTPRLEIAVDTGVQLADIRILMAV